MTKRRKTVGLIAFLKGDTDPRVAMPGCASYDPHRGGCLYDDVCLVQAGQRCDHFENVVLPTAVDIGLRESIYSQYRKHVGLDGNGEFDTGTIRRCPDCDGELRHRRRYCDDCARKRRRATYRKSRSKRNS